MAILQSKVGQPWRLESYVVQEDRLVGVNMNDTGWAVILVIVLLVIAGEFVDGRSAG